MRNALKRDNVSDIHNQPCWSKTLDKPLINYFEEVTRMPDIQEQKLVIRDALKRDNVSDIQNQPCSKTFDEPSINYFEDDTRMPNIQEQKSFNLEGRRIVNVSCLYEKIAKINHKPFDLLHEEVHTFTSEKVRKAMSLAAEEEAKLAVANGDVSENGVPMISVVADGACSKGFEPDKDYEDLYELEVIESEDPRDASVLDVNTSAVVAMVNSGQGYAQLDTFSDIINLPNMSNKLHQKLHEEVHTFTSEKACKTMSLAAEEEAKLAVANGDVSENGVPMISVVADGAWSKEFEPYKDYEDLYELEVIESEDPRNASVLDVNTSAVVAMVNSGQGYAQLDTFSDIMNLPNMNNKLYQKLHEEVHTFTSETAGKAMSLAAEEEAKLAVANGDVGEDGVPMISVVADGAWSKGFEPYKDYEDLYELEVIESEDPRNASVLDVNTSAVVAIENLGQDYAQLDTFSDIINLPNMSNKLHQKLHEEVHTFTSETAWKAMSLTAEEEAKLAVANGDVREDGVPMISNVADGAWSKGFGPDKDYEDMLSSAELQMSFEEFEAKQIEILTNLKLNYRNL